MTSIEWQRWCRLCAGSQDVIIPLYGLNTTSEIIERANKYLKLSISADADDDESLPQYVCKSCADYVEQLDTFAIQCARVQDLFFSLAREEPTEDNITLIRNIFLNNSDETQDHKDFEIVPVEPEIEIEKPSGKTRSSLNKKAKAAAAAVGPEARSKTRGRPKKCEKTIPRIRIRALPSPPPPPPPPPPLVEKLIVKKEAIKKETAKKESTKKEVTKKEVVKKEVTKKETAKKEATKKDVAKLGEQNTLVGAAKRKAKTPQSIVPKKRKEAAPPKKKERVKPVKVVKAVIERPREKAIKKTVYKSDDSEEEDDDDDDDDDDDEDYKEEKSEEKVVKDEFEEKEKETEDTEKMNDLLDIRDDIIKEENDEFDIPNVEIKEENEEQEPDNDDDEKVSSKKLKKAELKALLPSLYHFKCHVCDKVCKNWNSLGTHCKENHKETPQITCYCGKILSTRTAIIEHRARHTDSNMFKCDKCEKSFHRKSLLNVHQMSHVPKEQQPYVCCKCARRFHCEALLKNHERVHLPKEERLQFQCDICQKMFCSKSAVAAHHKAVHLGERPFVCHLCGHSFTSKGILQEHLTTHSDDAPWKCTKCEKCFKTKYRLKIHMDTHRETPYQCPKCPIQLSTRRTLRMHLVVHTDVKAYQCPICGKAFRRSKDLKNHSNLHTGRQPYTCPFCLRTFANGSNCRSHKRRMHPEQLRLMEASGGVWPDESSQKKTPEEEAAAVNRNENVINAGAPPPPNLPPPLPPPVPLVVENNKTDDKGNLNVNALNNSQIPEAEPRKADYPVTSVNNFSSSFLSFATTNDKRLTPVKPPPNVPMRPNFNQHFMEQAAGPHGYSSGHEQDNSSSSASPSFPGNPLIHHPFMFNRSIDP